MSSEGRADEQRVFPSRLPPPEEWERCPIPVLSHAAPQLMGEPPLLIQLVSITHVNSCASAHTIAHRVAAVQPVACGHHSVCEHHPCERTPRLYCILANRTHMRSYTASHKHSLHARLLLLKSALSQTSSPRQYSTFPQSSTERTQSQDIGGKRLKQTNALLKNQEQGTRKYQKQEDGWG